MPDCPSSIEKPTQVGGVVVIRCERGLHMGDHQGRGYTWPAPRDDVAGWFQDMALEQQSVALDLQHRIDKAVNLIKQAEAADTIDTFWASMKKAKATLVKTK